MNGQHMGRVRWAFCLHKRIISILPSCLITSTIQTWVIFQPFLRLIPFSYIYLSFSQDNRCCAELQAPLSAAGISPSSTSPSQIQSTLKQAWGVSPLVSCSSNSVYEIWLCINTKFQAITCPSTIKTRSCPNTVNLPKGNSVPPSCSPYFSQSG